MLFSSPGCSLRYIWAWWVTFFNSVLKADHTGRILYPLEFTVALKYTHSLSSLSSVSLFPNLSLSLAVSICSESSPFWGMLIRTDVRVDQIWALMCSACVNQSSLQWFCIISVLLDTFLPCCRNVICSLVVSFISTVCWLWWGFVWCEINALLKEENQCSLESIEKLTSRQSVYVITRQLKGEWESLERQELFCTEMLSWHMLWILFVLLVFNLI